MKMFKLFLLLMCAVVFCNKTSSGPEALTIEDLLVKDTEISGWYRTGEFWLAGSSTDLYIYINGAADLYNMHGFVEAVSQGYAGPIEGVTESIIIRIFDQDSRTNATNLFADYVNGMSNPEQWDETGDEARIERFDLSTQIVFRKSRYFVYLEVSSSLPKALDILKSFSRNMDLKIK